MEEYVSTPLKNIGNVIEGTVSRKSVFKNENGTHATLNQFVIGKSVNVTSVSKDLVMNNTQSSQVVNVLEDRVVTISRNGNGRQTVPQENLRIRENPVFNIITSDVDVLGPIKPCTPTPLTSESTAVSADQKHYLNIKTDNENNKEKNEPQNSFVQVGVEGARFIDTNEREVLLNIPRTDNTEKMRKNEETFPSKTDFSEHIKSLNPNFDVKLSQNYNVSRIECDIEKDPIDSHGTEFISISSCPNLSCMPTMNTEDSKLTLNCPENNSMQARKEYNLFNTQNKTTTDSLDARRECVAENKEVVCQSDLGSLGKAHVDILKQVATPCSKMVPNHRKKEGDFIGIVEKTPTCKKSNKSSPNIFCDWARVLQSSTPHEKPMFFDLESARHKYQIVSTPKTTKNNKSKNDNIKRICFWNDGDQDYDFLSEISSPHGQVKIFTSDCDIKSIHAEGSKTHFDTSDVSAAKECNSNISSIAVNEQLETSHSNPKRPAGPPIEPKDGVKKVKSENALSKKIIEIDLTEVKSDSAGVSLKDDYNNDSLKIKSNVNNDNLHIGAGEKNTNQINVDYVGNASDSEKCKFSFNKVKSEKKENLEMIHDDACEILKEVVLNTRKEMKLIESDDNKCAREFRKEVKTVKNKKVDLIVLDDNENLMDSRKDTNEIEIVENKPTTGDERKELKKGSVENFVSNDPKENDDNNNPDWELLKILETDAERYKAVRLRWRNLTYPDPNKNLTCIHIKPSFKHPNICSFEPNKKSDGNSRNSRKRTHSHEPTTSTDHVPVKRSRTRSCITTYDMKVRDVELKMEQKEKKLNEEKQCALADSQSFYHWQRVSLMSSNLRYYNNWEYQNRIAMLSVEQKKMEEAVHQNFGVAFNRLEDEKKREALVFKRAMKEVEAFHKFYRKLDVESADNDCFFLTDVELDDVVETDKLYEKFNLFYS